MDFTWSFFVLVLPMICCLLTIAVYLYVKELRNTLGKCVIGSLFSIFAMKLIWEVNYFSEIILLSAQSLDLSCNFCWYASILWRSVIGYHLWQAFKSPRRNEYPYQFLVYNVFVWVAAAILIGVEQFKYEHYVTLHLFKAIEADPDIFLQLLLLSIFDLIIFVLTVIRIRKMKGELKIKMGRRRREETTTSSLNFDTETYHQFIRMSIIRGVFWINSLTSPLMNFLNVSETNKEFVNRILLYSAMGFEIFVFITLILNRRTITLLMEKIRNRL